MRMIRHISTAEDLLETISSGDAVLAYFYHDGCAPCRQLRPKVEQLLEARFPEMDLAYVNALESPDIAALFMAFSYPVLIVFFEGKEFRRYSKYISVAELESTAGRNYDLLFGE
jgi:thioredoxin-like negative regulator of GroEL